MVFWVASVVVAIWLAGIMVNLLILPGYFDVAWRDFGLLVAAAALCRLTIVHDGRASRFFIGPAPERVADEQVSR